MDEEKIRELLIAEFRAIPPREELEKMYTFSERHNKLMEAMFAEERRKERFERYFRAVRRIAIVTLALLGGAVVSLKVVPTVYAYVEAWITENADDRLIFKDNESGRDINEKAEVRFELGYVPEGYELVGEEHGKTGNCVITYKNSAGEKLLLRYYKANGRQVSVDIEDALVVEKMIDGIKYYVFERDEEKVTVAWEKEDYLFKLNGIFEELEMVDIASYVKVAEDK